MEGRGGGIDSVRAKAVYQMEQGTNPTNPTNLTNPKELRLLILWGRKRALGVERRVT